MDFGATGDGKTLDSDAINRALAAAAAAGGGIIHFPSGTYLCYSIRLKSRVALWLDPGTTIIAADGPSTEQKGLGQGWNLDLSGIVVSTIMDDVRPALWLQDVQGAQLFRLRLPTGSPVMNLRNVTDLQAFAVGPIEKLFRRTIEEQMR